MALKDSVWWTRKARIQTEKRLLSNALQAQLILLWYSFCSVAASVYFLKFADEGVSHDMVNVMWIVFSVLVLCISGFINGLSFKERASLVKECYETLNEFYHKASFGEEESKDLIKEYEQVLGVCENHTDRDYFMALCLTHISTYGDADEESGLKKGLDRCPTGYHWLYLFAVFSIRFIYLFLLYALPIALFVLIESK